MSVKYFYQNIFKVNQMIKILTTNQIKSLFLCLASSLLLVTCSVNEEIVINPISTDRGQLFSYSKTGEMTTNEIISINDGIG